MAITITKPPFGILPRVPGVVALGLMAAQFLIFSVASDPAPKCTLNVERPHHSTYVKEQSGLDEIKLNITSTCNLPQKFTKIDADILIEVNNMQIIAHTFANNLVYASSKNKYQVTFDDLRASCRIGKTLKYQGRAHGEVHLQNGSILSVYGDSGKFDGDTCRIGAN